MRTEHQLPQIPPLSIGDYTLDLQYYVQKEYLDIAEAAVELPTVIEWLNYQHQIALEMKLRQRAKLERREADAYFELKGGTFEEKGFGDKMTADALKAAIALDSQVTELHEDVAIWTALEDRLERIARSLTAKLELVRSSEATRRKLIEG